MKTKLSPKAEAAKLIIQYMAIVEKPDLAKKCAIRYCMNTIGFVDNEMQGWCDADIIEHYESVIKEVTEFVI